MALGSLRQEAHCESEAIWALPSETMSQKSALYYKVFRNAKLETTYRGEFSVKYSYFSYHGREVRFVFLHYIAITEIN